MTAAVKVPHVHAEVIRAYADGAQIEYRDNGAAEWVPIANPSFVSGCEYRIKPEKVYPVTRMTQNEMSMAFCAPSPNSTDAAREALANAALRHAIDAGQIITIADHQTELFTLGDKLRDVEIARHADRDMAIATAVCDYIADGWPKSSARYFPAYCESLDLATIIAKVRP